MLSPSFSVLAKHTVMCLLVLNILSCTKDSTESVSNDKTSLMIQSVGVEQQQSPELINDPEEEPSSDSPISTAMASQKKTNTIQAHANLPKLAGEMVYSEEFDALVEMKSFKNLDSSAVALSQERNSLNKTMDKVAADVPISSDIKFRLLIYAAGNQTSPLVNVVLSRGESPAILLDGGKNYNWFAYSTNEANVGDINSTGIISKVALENKDFMFASGNLTLTSGQNYLNIIFKRQMAAVNVDVDTRGLFGTLVNNSSISLGSGSTNTTFNAFIQSADFNIFNASFSNFTTVIPSINASAMRVVDARWGNAEKIGTFYSAENPASPRTVAANQLKVRLNTFSITMDDNSTRTFSNNKILPIPHAVTLALTRGKLSRANVRLIESAVTIGRLRWARTNLIYDESKLYGAPMYLSGQSDAYRFRPSNNYTTPAANEYWHHTTSIPTGTDYFITDQCSRVYPQGVWTTPNYFDETGYPFHFNNLISVSYTTRRRTINGQTQYIIAWNVPTNQRNAAYPDPNEFILPMFGTRSTTTGEITGLPTSSTSAAQLHYWSQARTGTGNPKMGLYLKATGNQGATAGVTGLQQVEDAYNIGKPVRCIRNI